MKYTMCRLQLPCGTHPCSSNRVYINYIPLTDKINTSNYRISRPIRRTVIFSLGILEKKIIMNVF